MKRVGVAIVGAGAMGTVHARAFGAIDEVTIVTVFDPDVDAAERLSQETGAIQTQSLDSALTHPAVNLAVVATPEHLHMKATRRAIEAGLHVLVEKPFTADLEEALALRDLIRASSITVMTGHSLRFEPRYQWAAKQIADGAVGDIVSVRTARLRPRSLFDHYQRVHPALETAVHDVDIILWLTRSRVTGVFALERSPLQRRNPDGIWAILSLANGEVATVETSFLLPDNGPIRTDVLEVSGTEGRLALSIPGAGAFLSTNSRLVAPDPILDVAGDTGVTTPFASQAEYFTQQIRQEAPADRVPLDDVVHGLAVALAMIESARSGEAVEPRA